MDHRKHYVILAAALMGIGALPGNASGQPVARMCVHVVDYARLPANVLIDAQREASEIYAASGIDVVWVHGNEEDHSATALDVHVALLDNAMSNKKTGAARLSQEVLGIGSHNGWAYVFVNRVILRSILAHACFSRVLGRVIAHEIGHVVLPAHSHTPTGIMRETVDMLPSGDRYFTSAQAATLLSTLTAAR